MKKVLLLVVAFAMAISMNAQIFSDDFQDQDMSDWTTVAPNYATNPYTWHISDYSDDFYMSAAAYDGTNNFATEQWAISPAFDASGISSIAVTFDNRGRYMPYQDIECYVSTDFGGDSADFASATWIEVTGFTADASYDDYDWVLATTGTASITGDADTYVAFKYVSMDGGDGNGGNWVVNNVVVDNASAINEVSNLVTVYPNPVASVLNISETANVVVYTISGQEVINVANTTSVNVANLDAGVYFIQVQTQEGTTVEKIVKK